MRLFSIRQLVAIIYISLSCISCVFSTPKPTATKHKQASDIIINPTQITQEYVESVKLYYDDGPYTKGPEMQVNSQCWVYSYEFSTMQAGVSINERNTYYIPMDDFSVVFRANRYSGQGYHGGHLIILKDNSDNRFDHFADLYFSGKRLVMNKNDDKVAIALINFLQQRQE